MAQQKGSTASIMIGFETTFGTALADDGFVLPVNFGEGVVGTQSINNSPSNRRERFATPLNPSITTDNAPKTSNNPVPARNPAMMG